MGHVAGEADSTRDMTTLNYPSLFFLSASAGLP